MNETPPTDHPHPLIGILRGFDARAVEGIVTAAAAGGLRHLEITMNSPDATALIRRAKELAGDTMAIGAGTVLGVAELDAALDAGAAFVVTPIVNEAVIGRCAALKVPVFPGAFTPTEILRAWDLGATMVKLFPADQLGPAFVKNVKAPLPHIKVLPTGGITLESLPVWLAAGADGFGVGSPLFDQQRIAARDWPWLAGRCREFVNAAARRL